MARAGVRVGGRNLVPGLGVAELVEYRDRLGREPDEAIARAAGVSVEAVQGERRRLGIEPFEKPLKPARRASARQPRMDRDPGAGRGWAEWRLETARKPAPRAWRRRDAEIPVVVRRRSSPRLERDERADTAVPEVASAPQQAPLPPPADLGFDEPDRPEYEALLDVPVRRERSGRRVLVRPDEDRSDFAESEAADEKPAEPHRRRRGSRHSPVRLIEPSEVAVVGPEAAAKPEPPESDRVESVQPAPAEPRAAVRSPATPVARESESVEPAPAEPAPGVPEVVLDDPSWAGRPEARGETYAWTVEIDGRLQPFVVVAPDVRTASVMLVDRLDADRTARATLLRLGPVL